MRPRPHQAHIPTQHVHELRHFIDAIFPQQPPAPRYRGSFSILKNGPCRSFTLRNLSLCASAFVDHRSQLVATELFPLLSHAQRRISNWPTGIQPNPKSRKCQQRRRKNEPDGGYNDVDDALQGQPERRNRLPVQFDNRETTDRPYGRMPPQSIIDVRYYD